MMEFKQLKNIVEAALLAADHPLTADQLLKLFVDDQQIPSKDEVKKAIAELEKECEDRGYELKKIASGYRYQTRVEIQQWVSKLRVERPPKYSRAFMETLSLVVYRQPITRSEIEDVRGVSISSSIFKVLLEREWIKIVGHKEVPGRPAMYGTTKKFLDYFNLKTLNELPSLAEIKDLDQVHPELAFMDEDQKAPDAPVQLEVIEGGIETHH
ncbi:MAG: SMC-Scp complex subunit ScpB [Gammaproteobacteria bacterium]|nr:SMC-Scp complex subunit ScpB [Gammaproteobacteria bacterium]